MSDESVDSNKKLVEDTEGVFMFDEDYDIKKGGGNPTGKNNTPQLLSPSLKIFNVSTTKKETTKNHNTSTENVINKTNTPKSIEKIIYTLPDLDKNQTYSEDEDDDFRDFDCTGPKCYYETKDNYVKITDNKTKEESIKSLYTSNPIKIVKKEQEILQDNYETFIVANNNIQLFDDYTQNMSF